MRISIAIDFPQFKDLRRQLDRITRDQGVILQKLTAQERELTEMAADLTEITASVTEIEDAGDSAVLLLEKLAASIESMKTDPVALQDLANRIRAQKQELADAVLANTPVEPPVPPVG